jgi:hypothetical protein
LETFVIISSQPKENIMGEFLNRIRNKNTGRTQARMGNDRGAQLSANDPQIVPVATDLEMTGSDWSEIQWVDLAGGEGQVTFQMKVAGAEDASGNTPAADALARFFLAYGVSTPTVVTDAEAMREGEFDVSGDPQTWSNAADRKLSAEDSATGSYYETFTADALKIGVAFKKTGAQDSVISCQAHLI